MDITAQYPEGRTPSQAKPINCMSPEEFEAYLSWLNAKARKQSKEKVKVWK